MFSRNLFFRLSFLTSSFAGRSAPTVRETTTTITQNYQDTRAKLLRKDPHTGETFQMNIRRRCIRELCLSGVVNLIPLHAHHMVTDALTKEFTSTWACASRSVMIRHSTFHARILCICIMSGGLPRLTMLVNDVSFTGYSTAYSFVRTHLLLPTCPTMYGLFDSEWASGTWVD
jgi:hypothetical protein